MNTFVKHPITSQSQNFQALAELDTPLKSYFFCVKEIQALHHTVIYFIGRESNPQFKNDIKALHAVLHGSLQIISPWTGQLDIQLDAIKEIEETDDPTALLHDIYNDFRLLDADVQHLINLTKIACEEVLGINPLTCQSIGIELGTMQYILSATQRMATQLQSDIFSECDVLAELYPTIFKVEV